ncbi:tetratricopeptide repeat protein [Pseudobacteriovorax antillogorgiicola]|uniref:Tetratricopeptide repeat-containing protein n=1 Tax=Pseudobacteriovorax antillogorgiicola TaxID=1513793 RepID=A0A1Y6C5S4_9BACT|nr:tetratricopeptide repeat protein [Pseudobacteriovorax antillogorgiicola]TCS49411.1 tetratricopeptide repeat protein [Pseudobacteriovorax antillogorgiicola]SMF46963.1 Tetratricopeptide repeat-containing protein [Pseudobacteriovorax antillogorgiicola]
MLLLKRKSIVFLIALLTCTPVLHGKTNKKNRKAPDAEQLDKYLATGNTKNAADEALQKADDLRLKTIESIKNLTKAKMRDEQKFELFLRLGELYSERHDYIRELEIREYERKHDRWMKTKKGREPKLTYKRSKAMLYKAVEAFRKLIADYPRHPRSDAAMFSLAKTLLRLENDNSMLFFKQLIQKYPNSQYLPEAYLALGEHYFYKQNFNLAQKYYQSVLKYKNSRVYTYGVYKLGWTFFNQSTGMDNKRKAVDKAIAAFMLVVKLSERDKGKVGGFDLKQEAINDLIMVFAENQRTNQALNYFKKIGENKAFYDMLERMGNLYVENGEADKAIKIFNRLLREAPTRERNPEIYLTLVAIHDSRGNLKDVVRNLEAMENLYVKDSVWTRANQQDKEAVKKAEEKTKKNIHRYGTLYHNKGMKGDKKPYLIAALALYNLYLNSFPKADEAYELRYYLAEIHFHFGNFDKAADEYYIVSQEDGKYRHKSAVSAVAAMKKIDDKQKYAKLPPLGQVNKPMGVPKVKVKYIKMLDNFVKLLPGDKQGHPMRYTAAFTLFEYGHYKDSLGRFESIVKDIPKTKQGKSSVKMILGYYTEKKQWDELIAVCREFLANKNIINSKLRIDLQRTLRDSLFGQAVRYSKQRKFSDSAKAFVAYQEEFPKAKNADDALYNATLNYYKDGKVEDAISKGKKLLQAYPRSKHVKTTVLDIAQSHEALADFKDAAIYFEKFAKSYPKDKESRVTLYNAATLNKGLKQNQEAISLYKRYIKFYPKDKLARDALYEIADLYEKEKNYNQAVRYFQKHAWQHDVNSETYVHSMARSAEIQYNHGNRPGGMKLFAKLYDKLIQKDSPPAFDARRIIARAMFNDLNRDFTKFQAMGISSAKKIERDVKFKQNRLKSIVSQYQKVIDLASGEYTVASLYRVAEMHENFADELLSAPAPKGASQLEIDQYRSSIEKVAFPLKEEAEKYYEMSYVRSKEVQTFTNWTRLARAKMSIINEEKYPLVNERNVEASYLSHQLLWQEEVAQLGN